MTLTTTKVAELLISARAAVRSADASNIDRMILAAFALCGERGLTEPEMEALLRFVRRIATDLAMLELLETGEVVFEVGEDGEIRWSTISPLQRNQRGPM